MKIPHRRFTLLVSIAAIFLQLSPLSAATLPSTKGYAKELVVNPFITSNMVLQRNKTIKIMGHSEPRAKVRVVFDEQYYDGIANGSGEWLIELPAQKAGGVHRLKVMGERIVKNFDNILMGDVWICSGQSNMEMTVQKSKDSSAEIQNANYPTIRFFRVKKNIADTPQKEFINPRKWEICSPTTVGPVSAVSYYFARELQKQSDVPLGLVVVSWGGTPAESWLSLDMIRTLPSFDADVLNMLSYDDEAWSADRKKKKTNYTKMQKKRARELKKLTERWADVAFAKKWAAVDFDDSTWKTMEIPNSSETTGLSDDVSDGLLVFKKIITLPASWKGKEVIFNVGTRADSDMVYINGVKVGGMGSLKKQASTNKKTYRSYSIDASLLKTGENILTYFVYNLKKKGGLGGGKTAPMDIFLKASPQQHISLAGTWKYEVGLRVTPFKRMEKDRRKYIPTFAFNSMIHPLLSFPITGAIWYQGESNVGEGYRYDRLFTALIQDWRARWSQGEFPFYFVQLANHLSREATPGDSAWAELREAQTKVLRLPNTAMAVSIDIGEANDIHPKNKQDVGKRLAQNALVKHYGVKGVAAGPLYKRHSITNEKVTLTFSMVGSGLEIKPMDHKIKGFAIAGKDMKFVWAEASMVNDTIVVWSNDITDPVAVRYAWADNPECNVYNKEGFPMSPFRTDK